MNRGYRSLIVLPDGGRRSGSRPLGCVPGTAFFDEEELKLLNQLAGDISLAARAHRQGRKAPAYLAHYDVLTGLPNRALFQRLDISCTLPSRKKTKVTLFLAM